MDGQHSRQHSKNWKLKLKIEQRRRWLRPLRVFILSCHQVVCVCVCVSPQPAATLSAHLAAHLNLLVSPCPRPPIPPAFHLLHLELVASLLLRLLLVQSASCVPTSSAVNRRRRSSSVLVLVSCHSLAWPTTWHEISIAQTWTLSLSLVQLLKKIFVFLFPRSSSFCCQVDKNPQPSAGESHSDQRNFFCCFHPKSVQDRSFVPVFVFDFFLPAHFLFILVYYFYYIFLIVCSRSFSFLATWKSLTCNETNELYHNVPCRIHQAPPPPLPPPTSLPSFATCFSCRIVLDVTFKSK